jgi:YVTN family beta-propeller protein
LCRASDDAATNYTIFVSNERSGDVTVLDGKTRAVTATWPVGKRPRGIHLAPDGSALYVALSGSPRLGPGADPERARSQKADRSADGIAVVDVQSGTVRRKLTVGSDPEEFALSADGGVLFVSNEDEAKLSAWEITTARKIFSATVSEEPEGVAVHPTRPEVYVTCEALGEVFIVDASSGRFEAKVAVGGRPRTVTFGLDGKLAYVPIEGKAEVAVIDAATHRLAGTISIPGASVLPMGAALSRSGAELFVSTGRGNTVAVIDLARREVIASIAVGQRVWGIALSPDGRTLFTANGGSNDVSIIDVAARKEIKRVPVGEGPLGIAIRAAAPAAAARHE